MAKPISIETLQVLRDDCRKVLAAARSVRDAMAAKITRLKADAARFNGTLPATDIAALRQYDSSYKSSKAEAGVRGITFNTSVGEIEILPHPLQCDGKIQIFCPSEALRVGSTDITFIQRGSGGEKLILESATTPAGEMRTMSNQALFIEQPRHVVELSGITFG